MVLDRGGLGKEEQSELLSTEVRCDSLNCLLAATTDLGPLETVLVCDPARGLVGRAEADISSRFSSIMASLAAPVIIMLFRQAVRGEAGTGGNSRGRLADLWDLMVPALELSL